MKILAIDTSCDDTAISVLKSQNKGCFEILSNVVSSQVKVHRKYGGVYPSLAKREHQKNLVRVLKRALEEAGLLGKAQSSKLKAQNHNLKLKTLQKILKREEMLSGQWVKFSNLNFQTLKAILEREPELLKKTSLFLRKYQKPKIDAVAVTIGPGLEPCLWAGVNFAKALGFWWELPIIPVNHIEGHLLVNFLTKINKNFQFSIFNFQKLFPSIGLVVSGGHSQLVFMPKIGKYEIIGETRDDAAGECLDKTARILGLDYPGGPAIAAEARGQTPAFGRGLTPVSLPRPMINSKDYDFSFSGLKTAVLYDYIKRPKQLRQSKKYIRAMAKEIQQAVIDVLIKKTLRAAKEYKAKTIILGGGVAANKELRKQFKQKIAKEKLGFRFQVSSARLCTDNAAMIGITAWFHRSDKKPWEKIEAKANLRI